MRNALILLFIGVLQVHAIDTYSQKTRLSLNFSDTKLTEVLDKIESESEFFFLYNEKLLDIDRKVNIAENDQLINVILADLFAGTNVKYTIIDRKIILAPDYLTSEPQQKQITGKVTDESGNPLPGANIQVEGTTMGVTSDASGKYSINIPNDNAVLIFSFIGYNAMKVSATGKTTIDMTLIPAIANLEEVVVIGYGTAKKSDLTGSVVRANMSALDGSPNVSLMQALHGTVPGLNVGVTTKAGDDPSISIRGRNSISGSTSPLIVLDGIIYRGSIVDINPNDIESVDILKDASSTAIYGSQASNGVIIITTKTAKAISKPVIEYSSSFSIQSLTNKDMLPLDRDGFIQHLSDAKLAESRTGTDMLQPNPNFDVQKYFGDPTLSVGYSNGTNTNWFKLLSNKMPYIQDHNLSVRGKNELASYFLSMGYTDQKNLIINDTYKRYNVRVNLETKITNWIKVGIQSFFTTSNLSGVEPSFQSLMTLPPLSSPYDANGELLKQTYKGTINPLLMIQNPDLNKRYNISGNFYADLNVPFIKGLNYRMNFSQNLVMTKASNFDPFANTFNGSAYKNNNSSYSWTLDNIVTYKRDFGLHGINATLVYGVEKREYDATNATANNFVNPTLGYNFLAAGKSDLNVLGSNAWEEASLYSMGRLVYMYNNRYILTGTLRRDGFSGFGEKNKIGYFPSVALAWKLSEEGFVKNNVLWINDLKLRLSYGTNGNRTVGRYATLAKMSTQNPLGTGYSPITGGYLYGDGTSPELTQAVSTMSNADLKWETTTAFNAGLDFSVLNNRLFGNIEFYISDTKNLLYSVAIPNINGMFPDASGNNSITANIGKMQNIGEEFSITGVPVRTSDFEWNLTFNFSLNRNKVISILGIDANKDGKEDDLISNKIFIGKSFGVNYDYNIIGMWQLEDYNNGIIPNGYTYGTYKIEDLDGDNKITADKDRKILGYTDPSYRFSIQNTFTYKKSLELKIFINSIQGGSDYYYGQPGNSLPNPDNMTQNNLFKYDYWLPENPNARYRQKGSYTEALGIGFSPYVQRSFTRLQEVTLSYKLPTAWLKKLQINQAKVFVSGTNLLTFTDWDGWDPEANFGLYYSGYPLMKNYTLGVNFEF